VEEGIGLSAPVSRAVPEAVRLIEELLENGKPGESAPRATAGGKST
jgi:hydrogenase maturation protease